MKCIIKKILTTIFIASLILISATNLALVNQNGESLDKFSDALLILNDNLHNLTIISAPNINNTVDEVIHFNATNDIKNYFSPCVRVDVSETINIDDNEYINNTIFNNVTNPVNITNPINITNNINATDEETLEVIDLPSSREILFLIDGEYYAYFAVNKDARKSMLTRLDENTWYITGDGGCTFKIVNSELVIAS